MHCTIPPTLVRLALLVLVCLVALMSGCTHPCDALQERICSDLGPTDCATFRQAPHAFGGFVPEQYGWSRRNNGISQCQMFGSEDNYTHHVLPQMRFVLAVQHDRSTPPPHLWELDTSAGGLSGPWLYALMPLCVIGIFVYSSYTRRKLLRASAGAAPEAGTGPETTSSADSDTSGDAAP